MAAGLSQAELAERAGTSQPEIARLESPGANPRLETLSKVVAATGAQLELSIAGGGSIDPTLIADSLSSSPADRFRVLESMIEFAERNRGAAGKRRG